jgi:alpha-beta hydrolase superfamily lysophospholipase
MDWNPYGLRAVQEGMKWRRPPAGIIVATLFMTAACLPPEWGANAILHPYRRRPTLMPDLPFEEVVVVNDATTLRGWHFRTTAPRRGLIVYLHGSADNRQSGLGFARRFLRQGFDVLAYDSRAHGESGGDACTYGFHEKVDLSRALDVVKGQRAILFGTSLGGAVALQAAAVDPRVIGVISQSSFSDLETIVRERAPFFANDSEVRAALKIAETTGRFLVHEVSPRDAAARIRVPVLLIHGERDRETPPSHSRAIFAALAGPRELFIVPRAGHNDTLASAETWTRIDEWLARVAPANTAPTRPGTSAMSARRPPNPA